MSKQSFFVWEVEVECAHGHTGRLDDLPDGGCVIAFVSEDLDGRLHEGGALGVFLAPGLLTAPVGHNVIHRAQHCDLNRCIRDEHNSSGTCLVETDSPTAGVTAGESDYYIPGGARNSTILVHASCCIGPAVRARARLVYRRVRCAACGQDVSRRAWDRGAKAAPTDRSGRSLQRGPGIQGRTAARPGSGSSSDFCTAGPNSSPSSSL